MRPCRSRTANISRTPWGRALASIAIWSWSASWRNGIEHGLGTDPHACGLLAHRSPSKMADCGLDPDFRGGGRTVMRGGAEKLPLQHADPGRESEDPRRLRQSDRRRKHRGAAFHEPTAGKKTHPAQPGP